MNEKYHKRLEKQLAEYETVEEKPTLLNGKPNLVDVKQLYESVSDMSEYDRNICFISSILASSKVKKDELEDSLETKEMKKNFRIDEYQDIKQFNNVRVTDGKTRFIYDDKVAYGFDFDKTFMGMPSKETYDAKLESLLQEENRSGEKYFHNAIINDGDKQIYGVIITKI